MQISYLGICTCTSSHPLKEGMICCLFDVMQEFSGDEADNQIDMIDRGELTYVNSMAYYAIFP